MDAIIGIIVILTGTGVLMCLLLGIGLSKAKSQHEQEKERKLAMMKEYPHLAKEIWQSIEDGDARWEAKMKGFSDAISKGVNEFQKPVTPAPTKQKSQTGEMAYKLGLGIAKQLNQK